MPFLPFLIYAVYLLWKDRYKESALMFVIGFSGVLHSHVLSCELAIFLVFLLLLFNLLHIKVRLAEEL